VSGKAKSLPLDERQTDFAVPVKRLGITLRIERTPSIGAQKQNNGDK
jgi:hypothetical protein